MKFAALMLPILILPGLLWTTISPAQTYEERVNADQKNLDRLLATLPDAETLYKQAQKAQSAQRCAEAIPLFQQSLDKLLNHIAADRPEIYEIQLAIILCQHEQLTQDFTQGNDYTKAINTAQSAEHYLQQTLQQWQRFPDDTFHREKVFNLAFFLAEVYERQAKLYLSEGERFDNRGDYAQAEPLITKALSLSQKSFATGQHAAELFKTLPSKPDELKQFLGIIARQERQVASKMIHLALLHQEQERPTEVATLQAKSHTILEHQESLDYVQPTLLIQLQAKLAVSYLRQNQFEQAEKLSQKVLTTRIKTLPANHPDIADSQENLGWLYQLMGQDDKAEEHYRKSLEITQNDPNAKLPPPYGLVTLYVKQQKYDQAIPLLKQLVSAAQTPTAPRAGFFLRNEGIDLPTALSSLAGVYIKAGKYQEAQSYLEQNLAAPNNHLAPDVLGSKAKSLESLASIHEKNGQITEALERLKQAATLFSNHPSQELPKTQAQQSLARHQLDLLQRSLTTGKTTYTQTLPEAFLAAQQAHGSKRLRAFQQIALHLAAGDPTMQDQLRDLWAKHAQLKQLDKQYATSLTNTLPEGVTTSERLHQAIQETTTAIQQQEQALRARFPAYNKLAHPTPLTLAQAQHLLQPDEALMIWVENHTQGSQSHVLVVRSDRPAALHPLNGSHHSITNTVNALHQALILKKGQSTPQAFGTTVAHNLYLTIFSPAEADLGGIKHIIAVPDTAMRNLPLSLLVKTPPKTSISPSNTDYANTDWLLKHYSFTYLPSVRALADLRDSSTTAIPSKHQAFIGFGNPVLTGKESLLDRLFADLDSTLQRGGDGDFYPNTDLFRQLAPLPDTASELHTIAKLLNVSPITALFLADKATETTLNQLNKQGTLAKTRIISFATHALLPDNAPGAPENTHREAGLVLTPPKRGTIEDDGYLTASEAATLKLNADWVLLSACNTATQTATDAPDGISALAKAFMTAGAHSILASLWSVNSHATSQLMPNLFTQTASQTTLRRDVVLQQAMLAMLQEPAECNWRCTLGLADEQFQPAHPYYWSPFVIYGEGKAISP